MFASRESTREAVGQLNTVARVEPKRHTSAPQSQNGRARLWRNGNAGKVKS